MSNKKQNQIQEILENSTNPSNSLCIVRPGDPELSVTSSRGCCGETVSLVKSKPYTMGYTDSDG